MKLSALLSMAAANNNLDDASISLASRWAVYKTEFAKAYDNEALALAAFTENDAIIQEHNAKGLSWTLGHNQFSDMTLSDFTATHLTGLRMDHNRTKNYDDATENSNATFADSLDWVSKGAVTPVKNQAQCGSCWAFSTVGSIEGAYQIAGNSLTQFSEEELVDCDNRQHGGSDQGCNGGLMDNAFKWVKKNGLCKESDYPYSAGHGKAGTCKMSSCKAAVTLTGYTDVRGEAGMIPALNKGPVSVAIEADKSAFQLYKSGVLDSAACGKKLDHGVLAVGYGDADGKAYYKVKNSWGATWGENGYIRMVQGKDQCGIADSASYPTGVGPAGPTPPGPAPGPSGSNYKCEVLKGQCVQDDSGKFKSQALCSAVCV